MLCGIILRLLDGSVQLVGRAIYVKDFFNRKKVTETFGELTKIKEKEIAIHLGEPTFMLPFYITRPSLLTFTDLESTKNYNLSLIQ